MDFKKNRYNPYGTEQDELPQSSSDILDPAVSAAPVTDATLLASASPIGESFDEERVQKVAIGAQLETETGLIIQNHNSRLEIAEFNWFGYNSKTLLVGEKSTINFSLGSQGMSEFSFDYFALHNHSTVINFYDADGNLIGSEKLFYTGSVTAKQFDIKTLSFTAPAGMLIARAELITGDEPGVGDYGFHIDNVSWTSAGLIPFGFTFDRMDKDSGSSGSDFITKDGSEGRSVEGTLSRALASSETLQFWDGSKWVDATVTGMNWQAQDDTLHSADWEYKLRVVDAAGNATPEQSHQVVLDTTPSDVLVTFGHMDKDDGTDARDWETTDGSAGRTVYGSLNKALSAGDIIEYSLDGGKTWLALSVAADNSWSFNDNAAYTSDWEYQVRITDIAGNVTVPITQTVTLAEIMPVITEMWDNHGGNDLVANNGYSDDLMPTLKGTGQPGATLDVYAFYSNESNSKKIGSVLVKADGTWEWTPSAALQLGEITFDMVTKTGLASDPVTLNLVSAPTVDKAFDNAGQNTDWLANGDATDDSTPRLYGKALPDSLVYIYDNSSMIDSVTTDASGAWEWEHATGMCVGRHSITVKMEKGAFQSDFSQPWEFEYVSMQPVSFTLTSMQKDTGSSQTDFITKDGSANREVTGTLSRALSASETLQFWNGSAWVNASVTGMNWKAQDATAHSADWEYKLRVVNSLGDVSPEQDFQVVFDTTPSDVQVTFDHMTKDDGRDTRDWKTTDGSAGRTVHGTLNKALGAGDIAEYSLDGGKTWLTLSVAADNSWSFNDGSVHTGDWEYQVRIIDIAGNVTTPAKQAVTLEYIVPTITEVWDNVGGNDLVPDNGYSDDLTPTLKGIAHPGQLLHVYAVYNGSPIDSIGSVIVNADGTWEFTPVTPLPLGEVSFDLVSLDPILISAPVTITLVSGPTVDKAFDNAGQNTDWLANGDATDDSTPRLYGKALPDSLVYIYDNGSLIASVNADASGAWEWEHATGMSVGRHSITVKMEKGAFQSDFSQPWEFEYVSMQPVSFTLTSMQKDTGSSQTDFITNDGSANREVSGTISRALSASETLQFWNGSAWVNASVTGMSWKAQDATAHSADWEYKLRVVNSLGDVSPEQDFQVVLDTTPSDVQVTFDHMTKDDGSDTRDWETTDGSAGRTVHGTLSKALSADDIIEYSLDGGKTWLALSVAADKSWSFTDGRAHTENWEYQVRITDIAGNVTMPVKQAVTLTEIAPVITEIWDDVGNSRVVPHEGYTDDFTPRLVGTGHPNSQLEIWAKYGSDKLIKVGTVDVKADGTWTWTQPTPVTSETVRYAAISPSGLYSDLYDITLVKPPTIEKAYDDAGQNKDWLANGDATDDSTPRLYGKALPDSLVYIYDNGSLIASVTADASGAWEWEHATGMSVGRHSIAVKMEKGAFQSDFSQPWEFEYVSMQPVSFTLTSMQKDTGSSQTDFITKDGSANREVTGTLSRALSATETLQFWNGSAWVNASVTGMNWKAQDATAHSADWEYKLRVVNSLGDVSPEQDFQVVLDTTPSAVQAFFVEMSKDDGTTGDWQTSDGSAGRSVSGIFDKKLDTGDIAEYSLDGGKTWHPMTVNNLFWSFTDNNAHTTNWEYQVRITDIAGNTTTPVKQSVVLGDAAPAITEVWDDVGGSNVVLQNGYSDDLTPRLKGTGTPGDKIFIFLLDKSGTGTGHIFSKPYPVVDSKGNWEWTSPTPWPLGKTDVYVISQKTGAESAIYTFNLVEGPTIEKAFDDAGQTSEWLTNGATTDDSAPRLYGKALAGSLVYIYDNGKLISSVTADTNGAWEWEHATGMSVGKHSITVKMEKDAFQSDFSPPWDFEYISMQPITFTLTSMEKDTGISQTDLITNDGSANREVVGKISRKLVAGETLQFWNGSAWINATVTGKNWKAQDATAHTADWIYKLRVVDADGNFSPEKEFQVIYDITSSDNQLKFVYMEKDSGVGAASRDWITDDGSQNRRVYGTLDKSHKVTGVIVEYSLDGGKTWAAATLNGEQAWWFNDNKAHSSDWEYQVRTVDVAGNVSAPVKQNVTLEQIVEPTIGSVWDYVGGSDMVPQHGLSDDRHSTFKGTGKPNDTINFWVINTKGDIVAQGNSQIDANGNWSWTPIQELPLGDVIFQILESSGKPLPSYPITIVAPPTIEKAFDDVKNVALPSGATSADWSPEFAGKAHPNSVVQIYDGNKRIDSVKADANGIWEWEYAGGLSVGLHKINVKMKVGTFLSSSSADWEFIYDNPVTIKLSQMDKDTGTSQTDFITNDGTAGRNVTGTLSKALGAGETLNFWNGVSWSKATVTGTTWTARDNAAHSGNWQYRLQVADSKNNVLADQIKNVVLDKSTTAPAIVRAAVEWDNWTGFVGHYGKTIDRTPTLEGHVEKGATVIIQYGIDNGAWLGTATVKADSIDGRWVWTPTTPLYDEAWDFRIQYTDQAGNTSAWSPQFTIVIDTKSTFSVNDIAVNAEWDGSGIHGVTLDDNAPLAINTLNITGSNQSLDLSALQKSLSALNTIDLSGDGDNQLTLSAEDVLALGQHALFIDDDKKQIQVKGNEGDSAILARQLENFDANEWVVAKGTITSSGVEYHVWHNQNSDVEILIQAGLKTELM